MEKVKVEFETDPETFKIILDALWKKYEEEVRYIPGERLSDVLNILEKKRREIEKVVG
jgi:hypothetical protein